MQSQRADTAVAPETLRDLAIFSGRAAFDEPLHVGRPNIGDRAALFQRISAALDRRWLTNEGSLVREFEARIAALTGVRDCVSVVNATVGLQLLAKGLDLSGEVIVPSWTFIGTAHALSWIGLTPVFCEIDPRTHNLAPDAVEEAITDRTSAILGVHVWGRPCDIDRLTEIADRYALQLVFDAAHALGCTYRGNPVGGFGRAEVFSFHATKIASSAEGGAIVTNDAELGQRLRLMRAFGFYAYDAVGELGTNGKMNELSAAMGLTSLDSLDTFIDASRRNHETYTRELQDVEGLEVLAYDAAERRNYHYIVIELDPARCELSRDDLVAVLHAENVLARRYFHPGCHRLAPYRERPVALPLTEAVSSRVIVLPTGTSVGERDIATICSVIRIATRHGADVRRRLR